MKRCRSLKSTQKLDMSVALFVHPRPSSPAYASTFAGTWARRADAY